MNVKNHKPLIAGFGEILWDMLPSGRQLGGAPANFAYHAGKLGAKAFPVSCIGKDNQGTDILNFLTRMGITEKYISIDPEHPTGTVTVRLDENGVPAYIIHTEVAWDYIPWSASIAELAPSLDAVCFGSLAQRSSISRDTLRRFLKALTPGCLKVFDINLRQHFYSVEILDESLQNTDILKLNEDELEVVSGLLNLCGTEKERLSELLDKYSLKLIALTRGEKGSRLITAGEFSDQVSAPVHIADTVGAGDAFTAAMTLGWLKGESLAFIHRQANRLAEYVCSQPGAMPPIDINLTE